MIMELEDHRAGLQILNLIIQTNSWDILNDHELYDSDFRGRAAHGLKFLRKYYNQHGGFPPKEYLEDEICKMIGEAPALEFAVDKFKEDQLVYKLRHLYEGSFKRHLENGNPYECLDVLRSELRKIDSTRDPIISFKESGVDRIEDYRERKRTGIQGIRP